MPSHSFWEEISALLAHVSLVLQEQGKNEGQWGQRLPHTPPCMLRPTPAGGGHLDYRHAFASSFQTPFVGSSTPFLTPFMNLALCMKAWII